MFNLGNLADLGAHAEQVKSLVTGLLNSSQEANENSKAAMGAALAAQRATVEMHGSILVLLERLEKTGAPVDLGEVTGSGNSSQRPDDTVQGE